MVPFPGKETNKLEGYSTPFIRRDWESVQPLKLPNTMFPQLGLPANSVWYVCETGALPYSPQMAPPEQDNVLPTEQWTRAFPSPWTATSEIQRMPTMGETPATDSRTRAPPITPSSTQRALFEEPNERLSPAQDYSGRGARNEEDLFEQKEEERADVQM